MDNIAEEVKIYISNLRHEISDATGFDLPAKLFDPLRYSLTSRLRARRDHLLRAQMAIYAERMEHTAC